MAGSDSPLDLVIRFSTSNPDVILTTNAPNSTTGLSLKQQLRAHLDAPASESRLRLIHSGKVLQDTVALSQSLNVTRHPPPRDNDSKSAKAKGKQPDRDTKTATPRVYIHCSIGDALTPAELTAEAKQAQEADSALLSTTAHSLTINTPANAAETPATTTTPAPRGFDRLLTAGFTHPEVATLRTQFLAIQAHTHTPDTMPTGPALLALEEHWLDSGSSATGTAGAGEDTVVGGFDAGEDAGGLEDMLYGNLIGFFWPVGAMCWLMREEGVWSRRKQIAVLSGFLVNLTFGFLRIMN
ncbi:hypothetical protein LTR36_010633 [Oleoguttula mirabilis]|uniref:Ubiquitin-like domain-containing protein n=1 Tax=Oleoguttula mirabilis TaxID=1507867 RepID=A0AAV9JR27_9PEZI|nr:hypothetical protein LTR36_010633 [Oleoguttula mirabilis]